MLLVSTYPLLPISSACLPQLLVNASRANIAAQYSSPSSVEYCLSKLFIHSPAVRSKVIGARSTVLTNSHSRNTLRLMVCLHITEGDGYCFGAGTNLPHTFPGTEKRRGLLNVSRQGLHSVRIVGPESIFVERRVLGAFARYIHSMECQT